MTTRKAVVECEIHQEIGWIHLNRPERLNAVVPQLVEELYGSLDKLEREGVRAAILAGRGNAFCAGHDLRHEEKPASEAELRLNLQKIQDVTRKIQRVPFPVIAAVHGYALGAGCEFALGCDLIIAAQDAEFGFPEVSVGLSVTGGISHMLPIALGLVRAKELLFSGERFGASQALQLGLINKAVDHKVLAEEADKWAKRLAELPQVALAKAKFALNRGAQCDLEAAFELEIEHALATVQTIESKQAAEGFRKKGSV
ncbi:enoyl-CoA hydratase/isomerase family protein [Brevibacillus formosus]|uniref:enoyl-CoA hydratase/isomerase family protein n=1 Tax=Brevibacillus formosus TaxID=54913 RepID=UPI001C67B8F4|nr:enoyl-CoA hydratase/isomerase family protein [Brevibacillus formosus]MBW5467036.1 enoyl-CoA hydratase/isomerase family protein [Brevibacillus formosus]